MDTKRSLRTDKMNKNGYCPIRITVYFNSQRAIIDTSEKVPQKGWNGYEVKNSQAYSHQINDRLSIWHRAIQAVWDLYRNARMERDINPDEFKARVKEQYKNFTKPDPTITELLEATKPVLVNKSSQFFQLMEEFIESKRGKISPGRRRMIDPKTIDSYYNTLNKFKDYEKKVKLPNRLKGGEVVSFENMGPIFYEGFLHYLVNQTEQRINTFSKHIKRLKAFLGWVEDNYEDIKVNRRYRKFEAPEIYGGVDYITAEEVRQLQRIDFKDPEVRTFVREGFKKEFDLEMNEFRISERLRTLEECRDVFLMCVYTGMRISDLHSMVPGWIVDQVIKMPLSKKTDKPCFIPFYDDKLFKPVELVKKYNGRFKTCMPVNKAINAYLKDVQKLAKIDRLNLTTKIGRKTFAT